jgi:8-oxo-dGTP pyrophosphatase MutT (NUDIX family)
VPAGDRSGDDERELTEQQRFVRWARTPAGTEPAPIVAAATVVLLRDSDAGLETLMLRRDSKLAFAGGMWVFPGGRIDPGDFPTGDAPDEEALAIAERNAAVREAEEEAGLVLAAESLLPFAHWTPPPEAPKRFSTRFFVAPAPAGQVTIDDGEIRDHMWVAPADALARRDALEIELAPPTWVTLHTLARSASVADAMAAAEEFEVEHFTTKAVMTDDGVAVLWHGDAGYEDGDASRTGPRHRLWLVDSGWRYERTDPPPKRSR